jgi:hypothetical protein
MLQTGYYFGLIASPVSGLTNQQNWNTYGLATAGAVAPNNATTMTGIDGLVVTGISDPDVIIANPPSSASASSRSGGQGTTSNMIRFAASPLAQPQISELPSSIDPLTNGPAATTSAPTKSAVKVGSSKSATGTVIAGPLAVSAPRRNQVRQSTANSPCHSGYDESCAARFTPTEPRVKRTLIESLQTTMPGFCTQLCIVDYIISSRY